MKKWRVVMAWEQTGEVVGGAGNVGIVGYVVRLKSGIAPTQGGVMLESE